MQIVRSFPKAQTAFLACLISLPVASISAQPDRILGPIQPNRTALVKGHVHPLATHANDRGKLDPAAPISNVMLMLQPSAEQAVDLEMFLDKQRDPSSPDYQKWLTPEEYGDRFGLSPNDVEQIVSWLQAGGATLEEVARGRNWISFSGSASQVGKLLRTELHNYDAEGETHFANSTEPSIPLALLGVVGGIRGLNDFRPRPPVIRGPKSAYTGSNGNHYLAPDDLAAIYGMTALYKAGIDGTGQKLVVAGQTSVNLADIRGFRSQFNLPAKDPQLVLYGADPGASANDQIEADLDLEWAGAVARNATVIYVYSRDVLTSVQYAINQNLAPVISLSYGGCEQSNQLQFRAIAQQANAQGITWMNASGDSGAAGCDWNAAVARNGRSVIFPANIPEVTAVGGTEFNETGTTGWATQNNANGASASAYIPEKAWNDTPLGNGLAATGGGASAVFPKPWWQTGPGVPNDGARDVPDISLSASGAHDGYIVYAFGGLMSVGGTSASTPAFSGIVSLINQYVVAQGIQAKAGLGNINPNLYSLAQNTTGILHDITVGDNIVPCLAGSSGCTTGSFGYKAGPGYDLVTGLGSVDAFNLVTRWSSVPGKTGTTTSLTANPPSIAAAGSTQLTATVTVSTGSNPPTGTVTFSVGAVTLGAVAVAGTGSTATAGLVLKGSSLIAGSNTVTASFVGSGSFSNSASTFVVMVTGPTVATRIVISSDAATLPAAGTVHLSATVTAASGTVAPGGSVAFLSGTTTLGTATLTASTGTNSTATLAVLASKLSTGNNAVTGSYTGAGFVSSVSPSITITVGAPLLVTTTAAAANPSTVLQTGSTVLTASVAAASGGVPSGEVTFSAAGVALGTGRLTTSGNSAAASLTVSGASLTAGGNTLVATYGGDAKFATSLGTVTLTVVAPPVATSTTVSANPANMQPGSTTVLTVTIKPASGTAAPTGSINFANGSGALGSAPVTASSGIGTASLTVPASKLNAGSNNITASYVATGNFTGSSGSVSVTVASPVSTSLSVTANPASIASTATTQITVTIKPSSGTAAPSGTVAFTSGAVSLGSETLVASGTTGTATHSVKGSSLATGNNTIVATYAASGNFGGSNGATPVTVTAAATVTSATLTANPSTIVQAGSSQLTVSVKAASGNATPTGNITFAMGAVSLGTASLANSSTAGTATATLTIRGSNLAVGGNTINALYSGNATFSGSAGTAGVTVLGASASNVVATVTHQAVSAQPGYAVTIKLTETAGAQTSLTGVAINGTSFTPAIAAFFGGSTIAARGTLSTTMNIQWAPLPANLVFVFTGTDAAGRQWSQSVSLPTT